MNSNLEVNMVAQLGTRTSAVLSGEGVQSAAAMDPLLPAALEMANTSVFELSLTSGSGDDRSRSPAIKSRKRASSARPAKRDADGSGGRAPTLQLADRWVHRRAEQPPTSDGWQGARLAQIDAQLLADREAIAAIHAITVDLSERLRAQDAQILSATKLHGTIKKDILGVEKGVLHRLEAYKAAAAKDTETRVTDLRDRLRTELSSDGLTNLLRGREAPVLKPMLDSYMRDKLETISAKFGTLDAFMQERLKVDEILLGHIQRIDQEKPEDGKTIKTAFEAMAAELAELKAASFTPHQLLASSHSQPSSTRHQPYNGHTDARPPTQFSVQGAIGVPADEAHRAETLTKFEQIRKELIRLNHEVLQGKCHCVHVDQHEGRLLALERVHERQTQSISILEKSVEMLRRTQPTPHARAPTCSPCGDQAWDNWKPSCPPGCDSGDGGAGDSHRGDGPEGYAWFLSEQAGGNGFCHCVHVAELLTEMDIVKQKIVDITEGSFDPWADGTVGAHYGHGSGRKPRAKPQPLPLKIGALGQLHDANARLFDDRLASQSRFQFDGNKGGVSWKGTLERYIISKCPAMMEILEWAEKWDGEKIDHALLIRATMGTAMDATRLENMNNSIWGFLSNCLSSEAETIFKTADKLQGIDAWRRVIRFIDHGRDIKLEGMRNEMKMIHTRTIKNLENVPIGIAEFELQIKDYVEAGGTQPTEEEMKSDLVRILPEHLQVDLLWRATDPGPYTRFRDMVKTQAARTLLNRRRLPVHALGEGSLAEAHAHAPGAVTEPSNSLSAIEELLAAFRRGDKGRGKGGGAATRGDDNRGRGDDNGGPRKCPNCTKEHKELKCPYPKVEVKDRACWTCGKTGHSSANCPDKKTANRSLKTVEEELADIITRLGCVDHAPGPLSAVARPEGFEAYRKTFKPRHDARTFCVGDYLSKNRFGALDATKMSQKDKKAARRTGPSDVGRVQGPPIAELGPGDDGGSCLEILEDNLDVETEKLIEDAIVQAMNDPSFPPRALSVFEYENRQELLEVGAQQQVRVSVAADSGAVTHVISPGQLPAGVRPDGVVTRHFVGASDEHIEAYGACDTVLGTKNGRIACKLQVAEVARALHSVSETTGPEDGPGTHDVLFNNKVGVVVPAGIVNLILTKIKPILQYERRGGLYCADVTVSGFARPGPQK